MTARNSIAWLAHHLATLRRHPIFAFASFFETHLPLSIPLTLAAPRTYWTSPATMRPVRHFRPNGKIYDPGRSFLWKTANLFSLQQIVPAFPERSAQINNLWTPPKTSWNPAPGWAANRPSPSSPANAPPLRHTR